MSDSLSKKRASMPAGTNAVLDTRSVTRSNANLLQVLQPGQRVLDVGCGSGAITHGICEHVAPAGEVVGVDRSEALIVQATQQFANVPGLSFQCIDVLDYNPPVFFDVITTARTLQWVSNPEQLVAKMATLLKPGGILCVLDYDHTALQWEPQPPASMQLFYKAFLQWRSDAGMNNSVGLHVAGMIESNGLKLNWEQDQSEFYQREQEGFATHINIWAVVAETRGKQMVEENYVTEEERLLALTEYKAWCATEARSMKLVLKATHASKKRS